MPAAERGEGETVTAGRLKGRCSDPLQGGSAMEWVSLLQKTGPAPRLCRPSGVPWIFSLDPRKSAATLDSDDRFTSPDPLGYSDAPLVRRQINPMGAGSRHGRRGRPRPPPRSSRPRGGGPPPRPRRRGRHEARPAVSFGSGAGGKSRTSLPLWSKHRTFSTSGESPACPVICTSNLPRSSSAAISFRRLFSR